MLCILFHFIFILFLCSFCYRWIEWSWIIMWVFLYFHCRGDIQIMRNVFVDFFLVFLQCDSFNTPISKRESTSVRYGEDEWFDWFFKSLIRMVPPPLFFIYNKRKWNEINEMNWSCNSNYLLQYWVIIELIINRF